MKRTDVFCKICGQSLRKYSGGTVYHCENNDMSHRGLIPADVVEAVPRYIVSDANGKILSFVTKKHMIEIIGKRAAAKAKRIQKVLA